MKSSIVVISWWSNCLGLRCLHNICKYTSNRKIYVIQVGKQEPLKVAFRKYLPTNVCELYIPENCPAEHWAVCEWVAKEKLKDSKGLWFFDHDFFLKENCNEWLNKMDAVFVDNKTVLAYPSKNDEFSITNPAFWISPKQLPKEAPGFSPIPSMVNFMSEKPYGLRKPIRGLKMPKKDTMVACMEYLNQSGLVTQFSLLKGGDDLIRFPAFSHLGGLYLFTYLDFPGILYSRVQNLIKSMKAFFKTCPPEWLEIEDPVLLKRIADFEEHIPVYSFKTPSHG